MTYHLFGAILTPEGVASNNRGESAGNVSTLQKIVRGDDVHTTVSAEAVRYAMREYWTRQDRPVVREIDPEGEDEWQETGFEGTEQDFVDHDLFGYMAPKEETVKRRGRFEISRSISTRPWTGETMFNVASPGAKPDENSDPTPYSTEVHTTRYQYLFALTPDQLAEPARVADALEAVQNLSRVAGNHSRYLYEFSPEAVVLRWTHDPSPRMMYCFDEDETGRISVPKVIQGLDSGDLGDDEVVAGGKPLTDSQGEKLSSLGASVHAGIKAAFDEVRGRISDDLGIEVA